MVFSKCLGRTRRWPPGPGRLKPAAGLRDVALHCIAMNIAAYVAYFIVGLVAWRCIAIVWMWLLS